eukprot:CAMPEP_0172867270 /NCGR_PEP_ID=MMETSP1075-20121228/83158_1 /TAXON_ID=2916 /ORGANISM="Ceratium fusus, Strain PA161109" /LENGTH=34 /DNA_ID= /DNA_START= /DNA_END= /DNA_ORIENTATION=
MTAATVSPVFPEAYASISSGSLPTLQDSDVPSTV